MRWQLVTMAIAILRAEDILGSEIDRCYRRVVLLLQGIDHG
jgi:hypothetical protein